ncbi:gentisate 1,2-dioxygenase [Variovorax sp. YR752]|uniref:cupin domain-containing protein n=1 Tax=unclassified Variovorax TaxID=663243 RepID=UPI000BD70CDB|nr:gentisate 1,2-dioxygenase [Variovorax sp. YR752]
MQDHGRLDALGRLEDLPQEYRDELRRCNLMPFWPSLRSVLPPGVPSHNTQLTHWSYAGLRPLLMQAGELTPIEKAERRVLVLANPGHRLENMKVSPAMYLGMQLLLPGEKAPTHRHTPNAVRMVVEGKGACTTVNGEKCSMERGDLIHTPTGMWHEHAHEGDVPVIWLDVLDLPLIYYAEVSYVVEGSSQEVQGGHGERAYARGGVVPSPGFERSDRPYPLVRYPWTDVRYALLSLAADRSQDEPVQVTYVNPETGHDPENNLGFHALMLRPGQELRLPARSPACAFARLRLPSHRRRCRRRDRRHTVRAEGGRHLLRSGLHGGPVAEPGPEPAQFHLPSR